MAKLIIVMLLAAAGVVYGETISVTSFGRGSTRSEAIESGKWQAVKDAFSSSFSDQGAAAKATLANPSEQINRTRIVGVTKLGPSLYEAEIEADVDISAPVSLELRKRVGLVGDLNQPDNDITGALLAATRDRLSRSNRLIVIDRQDPAIAQAIEHLRAAKGHGTKEPSRAGKPPPVDVLCVIATETLIRSPGDAGTVSHEMKTRITIIDVATAEIKQIRTVKSVRAGTSTEASEAIARDASKQISTVVVDYVTPLVESANFTKVIMVPTGHVKLGVGQPVSIYKVTKASSSSVTREVSVTTGEVISVGPSYAKVITENYLVRSDRHIVKPIANARPRGVVLESDW
jgi:hypothetical protein